MQMALNKSLQLSQCNWYIFVQIKFEKKKNLKNFLVALWNIFERESEKEEK